MIMEKEIMRKLEKHLRNYNTYKEEILDIEESIINNSGVNNGIKSKHRISKTVEKLAIDIASNERINCLKYWVNLIDDLRAELINDPIKTKLIQYKYIDLNYNERISDMQVLEKLEVAGYPMSKNLYYVTKEQIFYKFEKMAKLREKNKLF